MKLRDLLYFNRSDRMVLGFFLCLAAGALTLLWLLGGDETTPPVAESADSLQQRSYRSSDDRKGGGGYYVAPSGQEVHLFPFDPNTADSTELLQLGLRPWQVRAIYRYRAAGGVFSRPSDFARLYGLTQKQYRQLKPYIRIASDYRPASELAVEYEEQPRDTFRRVSHKIGPNEHVALNTADTTQLMKVPGIGSYFARRIVSYRQRLGGFASADQLREIDDFPASAVHYFTVDAKAIRRLNVNKLSLKELKRHPYLNYYQAKAILDYRRLKGPLHSLSDLRLLPDFTSEDLRRLEPYVEF